MNLFEYKGKVLQFNNFNNFLEKFSLGKKDLVITSNGIFNKYLKKYNLSSSFIFHDNYNKGEPSKEKIDKILNESKNIEYNRVIAVGGGTVLDISKLLILKNSPSCSEIFYQKKPIIKDKKLICIPTTCGTGSEVTNISIAKFNTKNTKLGISHNSLRPDYAILIPNLLVKLPFKYYMYSSIDALIHAIESFLSPNSNVITKSLSEKSIKTILKIYINIKKYGKEIRLDYLDEILMGSLLAGLAFDNAGVGAIHALSYPLGGKYHVPHGESNFIFLFEILNLYNKKSPNGDIKDLILLIGNILETNDDPLGALESLILNIFDKPNLRDYGMAVHEQESFTNLVIQTQQRLLKNNYVPLTKSDIFSVYNNLY